MKNSRSNRRNRRTSSSRPAIAPAGLRERVTLTSPPRSPAMVRSAVVALAFAAPACGPMATPMVPADVAPMPPMPVDAIGPMPELDAQDAPMVDVAPMNDAPPPMPVDVPSPMPRMDVIGPMPPPMPDA